MHSPTESEFEAFPPILKRKYFSAQERLHYAQAQARVEAKVSPPNSTCRRFSRAFTKPAAQLATVSRFKPTLVHHNGFLRCPSARQHRRPNTALTTKDISQEDALWFSTLPDKVKRGQFSKEEQILLAGKQGNVIPDVAEERVCNLGGRPFYRSVPSLRSFHSHATPPASFGSAEFESFDSSLESYSDRDDFESLQTEEAMDEEMLTSFRWLDEDEPDLALDDYHVHVSNTTELRSKSHDTRPNYRRNRSLTNFTFSKDMRSSLDKRPQIHTRLSRSSMERWGNSRNPQVTPLPPLPAPLKITLSQPLPSERVEHLLTKAGTPSTIPASAQAQDVVDQTPLQGTDAGTEHYLNPEARLQLRLYLATPSKFDEALEFGFPSFQTQSRPRASTSSRTQPSVTSQSSSRKFATKYARVQPLTFFNDDEIADLTSSSDNGHILSTDSRPSSSVYSMSHPATPGPNSPALPTPTLNGKPEGWIDPTGPERDSYLHESPGREMTLRMTLTRPDLRAEEGILYPNATPHPSMTKRMALTRSSVSEPMRPTFRSEPLSLEDLTFNIEALPTDKPKDRGIWKLLTRRW